MAEEVVIIDARQEPFVRLSPEEARLAAEGLQVLALANRAIVADGEAEDDWHAAVLADQADRADQAASYLEGWADAWSPR